MAYPQFSVVPAGTLYLPAGTRFPTDESAGYFQPSLSGFFRQNAAGISTRIVPEGQSMLAPRFTVG